MPDQNYMTKEDASRIQSAEATKGGDMGFASRAQSAGDRNANSGVVQKGSGGPQGVTGGGNGAAEKK
ncbi:hypothetical protein VPNG_03382 [Cytospora leucostoma]|uniref:SMP domain-containing protein n=1 Tax=Cytospora leucostoma TaxID=1230097 RepID=A0A423XFH8_9PEZI|nr:hypothetical protein VPNG_03382 [Cytospora leucostoma]